MKRCFVLTLALLMCLAWPSRDAFAEWVWTKETGWINVNKAIRRSAKEIYEDAKTAYDAGNWDAAYDDYKLLSTYLAESRYTEESMFRTAECLFQMGRFNASYRHFKDYLFYYPGTKDIDLVLARLHEIGKAFLYGRHYDSEYIFNISASFFSNREAGADILTYIVDNFPYVPESEKALRTIADYHFKNKEYSEAVYEYEKLLSLYTISAERDWAAYRIGDAYFHAYEGPSYTVQALPKAKEAFRQYLRQFPEGKYPEQAKIMMQRTIERQALKEMWIADYYLRTKHPAAAYTTLQSLLQKFPDTESAGQTKILMEVIQPKAEAYAKYREEKLDRVIEKNKKERERQLEDREKRKEKRRKKMERRFAKDLKRQRKRAAKEEREQEKEQ